MNYDKIVLKPWMFIKYNILKENVLEELREEKKSSDFS